MSAALVVTPKK